METSIGRIDASFSQRKLLEQLLGLGRKFSAGKNDLLKVIVREGQVARLSHVWLEQLPGTCAAAKKGCVPATTVARYAVVVGSASGNWRRHRWQAGCLDGSVEKS